MAQQSFAGLAVLIALAFAIMALNGCASSEQRAQSYPITAPAAEATPEYHGARIGRDEIRSRLDSEG